MLQVVGTLYIENRKLLLDKPRKRPTHQMIGGKIEPGETPIQAAYRESIEELGSKNISLDAFEYIMDFEETPTTDPNGKMRFYLFKYNGTLTDTPITSEEIESFLWYDSSLGDSMLSYTLKDVVIPYCLQNDLID